MSGRPTHEWKKDSKCAKCLDAKPDIGKHSKKDKEDMAKLDRFNNALKAGKKPNKKDIITFER